MTRGLAASAARDAVFNTNELLETICQELSIEDLLTARHVNHHWNLLITRSSRLQRCLFRMQGPRYHFWVFDTLTEVLREYQLGYDKRFGEAWVARQNVALPSTVNPLLFKANGPGIKGSLVHRAKYCESMSFKTTPNLKLTDSWMNNMFLCLPAPRDVEFCIFYHRSKPKGRAKFYGDGCIRGKVENIYGVTLGDVLDEFLQEARIKAAKRLGPRELAEDYVINAESSVLWMAGHVFPTQEEFEQVKENSI